MSSQKGNVKKSGGQKYQNSTSFKNNLHDKSDKTKFLNSLQITDVCLRCKSILEWKIKYKKYKLLKNPSTCVKCKEKKVTQSYRIMCQPCALKLKVCPKCGKPEPEWLLDVYIDPAELALSDEGILF